MSGQKQANGMEKVLTQLRQQLLKLVSWRLTQRSQEKLLQFVKLLWQPLEIALTWLQKMGKNQGKWLYRRLLLPKTGYGAKGFLLPTVAVLLVVMSLVIGSILFRSVNRTMEVTGNRQAQATYNAATPAIDRAKAKLEYLFQSDPRWPRGLPPDNFIEGMLLNQGTNGTTKLDIDLTIAGIQNPYDLPDETRIDINNDGVVDNAWVFQIDADGDGQLDTVSYSLLMRTRNSNGTVKRDMLDTQKAPQLVMRNGPMNMKSVGNDACDNLSEELNDGGWDVVDGATVRRSFQVTALVVNSGQGSNRTIATLEMQQDRQAVKGNKWGAWFRNDLEIFPGPDFRWNGAMHTEGNLMVQPSALFRAYLISAPSSCLYSRTNSEISLGGSSDETTPPFLGQIVSGSMKLNNFGGDSTFDIHNDQGAPPSNSAFTLDENSDSLTASTPNPVAVSLDPVVLFTTGNNQARGTDANNKVWRISSWKNSLPVNEARIFNQSVAAPYVDDTYRADNRYGPKPRYTQLIDLNGNRIGDPITGQDILTQINEVETENNGLDGYWERRSYVEGLRVIVGQRLELGNTFGWKRAQDPLYPPQQGTCTSGRCHEQRQWRTLRDNLAAVQASVIYHNDRNGGDPVPGRFPLACLATTAHPGTGRPVNETTPFGTIANSTTFNTITANNVLTAGTSTFYNIDFLNGTGTNGWEFNPPAATEGNFMTAIATPTTPLRIAMRNLANFSGDTFGAFPPRQDVAGAPAVAAAGPVVHPFPYLSMWGNNSELRRVLNMLDGGTSYSDLSLADQTTLHTAGCTLGMLAYNLNNYNKSRIDQQKYAANATAISNLATNLNDNFGDTTPGLASTATTEQYVKALRDVGKNTEADTLIWLGWNNDQQIERDRRLGFKTTDILDASGNYIVKNYYTVNYVTSWSYGGVTFNSTGAQAYKLGTDPLTNETAKVTIAGTNRGCNASPFNTLATPVGDCQTVKYVVLDFDPVANNYFGLGPINSATKEQQFLRLAIARSNDWNNPKYPALYYIFPKCNHNHLGSGVCTSGTVATADDYNHQQPNTEEYINQVYIQDNTINGNYTYRILKDSDADGFEENLTTEDGIGAIAIQPRPRINWVLPNTTTQTNRVNFIRDNGAIVAISLLDKGMFNGREMMSVRTMDFDLDLLRNNSISAERWLPFSGIVYAFREDAVREDAIARPRRSIAFTACNTAATITGTANCRMDAVGAVAYDPPINTDNFISPKAVDFYADPDRRPHGFRLRNGQDLRRSPAPPTDFELRGLSFISDNTVYLVADNSSFNLHNAVSGGAAIQEFSQALTDDWSNFYTRSTLNNDFARAGDTWRPAEIIADGISILSQSFRDGSMAELIRAADVNGTSSYRDGNAPSTPNQPWVRENWTTSSSVTVDSPIIVTRNGYPVYDSNGGTFDSSVAADQRQYGTEPTPLTYIAFSGGKTTINPPTNTRINVTIISGIVPSRAGQSYGGFHNFPRFLENWQGRNLRISGAFIQLNFSTSATAPFDQDSWEPGAAASSGSELITYYGAPNRLWGYDVGLQYSPAGPVANRFITPGRTRSEFYRELPITDPYVCNLRKATFSGKTLDSSTSDCP